MRCQASAAAACQRLWAWQSAAGIPAVAARPQRMGSHRLCVCEPASCAAIVLHAGMRLSALTCACAHRCQRSGMSREPCHLASKSKWGVRSIMATTAEIYECCIPCAQRFHFNTHHLSSMLTAPTQSAGAVAPLSVALPRTPPEVAGAREAGGTSGRARQFCDMWSFGALAFAALMRAPAVPSSSSDAAFWRALPGHAKLPREAALPEPASGALASKARGAVPARRRRDAAKRPSAAVLAASLRAPASVKQ